MELDGERTNEGWDFVAGSLKRRHVPSDGWNWSGRVERGAAMASKL